jgi:nucleotide-binding universal stress UspA family protein
MVATLLPGSEVVVACVQIDTFVQIAPHLLTGDRPALWQLWAAPVSPESVAEEGAALAVAQGVRAVPAVCGAGLPPAHALARLADEIDAELIVVGKRARKTVMERLVMDVPTILLKTCSRPVMVVPALPETSSSRAGDGSTAHPSA